MQYWPVHTTNLGECFEPYLRLMDLLRQTGGIDARQRWDANGWYASNATDPSATICLSHRMTVNTGWLMNEVYDHYRYTGDEEYLRDIAYALMKGAAEFYLSLLVPHSRTGELVLSPSHSPEDEFETPDGKTGMLCEGCAYDQQTMTDLFQNLTLENLFANHPPFQTDANFGITGAMAEMLLQSRCGEIRLLPALPRAWRNGTVTGLCARGGFEVDLNWADGRLTKATIRSRLGLPCRVRYGARTIDLNIGKHAAATCLLSDFQHENDTDETVRP